MPNKIYIKKNRESPGTQDIYGNNYVSNVQPLGPNFFILYLYLHILYIYIYMHICVCMFESGCI